MGKRRHNSCSFLQFSFIFSKDVIIIKVAILDNHQQDMEVLLDCLNRYSENNKLSFTIECFNSEETFVRSFAKGLYDIIFLENILDAMSGIDIAKYIRQKDLNCLLIFTASTQDHALESYRVRAFDYLLKPLEQIQIDETLTLAMQFLGHLPYYIEVKEGRSKIRICISDILYTDHHNHYVFIHTKKRLVKSYLPFAEFAQMLAPYSQFLLCYRNCMINMDEISHIDGLDFVLKSGVRVPITKRQQAKIKNQYTNYLFLQESAPSL